MLHLAAHGLHVAALGLRLAAVLLLMDQTAADIYSLSLLAARTIIGFEFKTLDSNTHLAAQGLHLAASGLHLAAQGLH